MAIVLEEHHNYLSLHGRSELFQDALIRTLCPGDLVADLGCGFGILGILALEAGAARVWGIDHSDAAEIARETVERAELASQYSCIRASTFQAELLEKVDLIICDHVGYFGFDYGIVEMLEDARRRFLKPGGKVMPRRLRLMLAGTSSPKTRAKADAWDALPVPPQYRWLREYAVNTKYSIMLQPEDLCTCAAELGQIDLREDSPTVLAFDATLQVARDGQFDGLAGWFECELADDVWMTNSPLAPQSPGRIDRSQALLPCREPFAVKAGDEVQVSLRVLHASGVINWTIREPGNGRKHRQSTWNSTILSAADLIAEKSEPLRLNRQGIARKAVLDQVDGRRTPAQVEEAVLRACPGLFPTESEIRRFVRRELGRDAE